MQLTRTVEPFVDPVSISRVKEFLRVDNDEENTTLNGLILAATNICEKYLHRSLITQTWTMYADHYPRIRDYIQLEYGPAVTITSVTSYLSDDTTLVFPASDYYLTDKDQVGKVTLKYNEIWDASVLRPRNNVEVIYVAGYGDDPEDIPFEIRQGILSLIAYYYEHREEMGSGIPSHIEGLWAPHKVWTL